MQYYTVKDVSQMTGCEMNKSYEIIRELNKQYKKKFPNAISIQGKVPKWFFEETMGIGKEGKINNEEN